VGSVALWVLMSIPSALRNGDDQPGQTVGALLGGLLGTFAIALLLRVIYVRLVARERPVLSPWVFVIAAVLALMVNLSQVANETAEREAGEPEAGQAATAASPEDLLVALPEGVRYETISAAQRQEIERSLRAEVPNGEIAARSIRSEQPPVTGLAVGLVAPDADDLDRFQKDFEGVGGDTPDRAHSRDGLPRRTQPSRALLRRAVPGRKLPCAGRRRERLRSPHARPSLCGRLSPTTARAPAR